MVSFDQNTVYIIAAIILIIIILLAIFMRRRGSKKGPSNINHYLDEEAKKEKSSIMEKIEGMKSDVPLYKLGPQDRLNSIRENTKELQHKNAYQNRKVEDRIGRLESEEKHSNLQKQFNSINKKLTELNSMVKPKKDK